MEHIIDSPDVLMDFMRTHLVDPRARAEASESDTSTATAGQTVFNLTASVGTVSCVTGVTVAGVAKSKWKDYHWDYQNERVTFYTGITLNDTVIITYKYGENNWIYSDKPASKIDAYSFPRISVFCVSGSGTRLGQYNAPVSTRTQFQIDVWSREGQVFDIDSRKYSNDYLGRYLGGRITKAFEDHEDDLFNVLYGYVPVGIPRAAPFSEEYRAYHTMIEVSFSGLDSGRIEK